MNKAIAAAALIAVASANKDKMKEDFNRTANFDIMGAKYDREMINKNNKTTLTEEFSLGPNGYTLDATSQRPTPGNNKYQAHMIIEGEWDGEKYYKFQNATVNKDNNEMRSTMIEKFSDYFMYALKTRTQKQLGNPECSTSAECGDSNLLTYCCVNAVMKHEKSGQWENIHRCMTKGIVDANFNMNLGDFTVNMQCVGSGAKALAATGVAAATLAAMTLY